MTDLFWSVVAPASTDQLTIFYLAWIGLYVAINVVWDVRTSRTPPFHVAVLTSKLSVLYNAATFTSSLLIVIATVSPNVRKVAGDTVIPLLLAGLSGVFVALSEICPYKPNSKVVEGPTFAGPSILEERE